MAEAGRIVACNEAAAKLLVLSTDQVAGQLWPGLDANTNQFTWRTIWRKVSDNGRHAYSTSVFTSREFLRPVHAEVTHLESGHALVRLTDQLDGELLRAKLEVIERQADIGMWSYNRIDKQLYFSDRARELLGLPAKPKYLPLNEVTEHLAGLLTPDQHERILGIGQEMVEGEQTVTENFIIQNDAGTRRITLHATSVSNTLHVTYIYGFVCKHGNVGNREADLTLTDNLATFSLDQAPDMIFWTRPDGTVYYANHAVSNRLGYTLRELKKNPIKIFAPDFTDEARDAFWAQLREDQVVELEYELVTKSGEKVQTWSSINYIRFGEEEYCSSICKDITQRKQLERRQRLMQFTFDQGSDMVIWSRPDGTLFSVNQAFYERLGYTEAELSSLTVDQIAPKVAGKRAKIWARLRKGEKVSLETDFATASGDLMPVFVKLNYLVHEGDEFNCVYVKDIRKQKRADKLLHLSRAAMDNAVDTIAWVDGNYRILYLNDTLEELAGRTTKELTGEPITKLFRSLKVAQLTPGSSHLVKVVDAEGAARQLDMQCNGLRHDGEQFLILIGRDVSALTNRQRQLENAYAEIAELRDRLQTENLTLREDVGSKYNVNNIITTSPKYREVLKQIGRVAEVDTTVLITGETGTGKELLARAVHQLSERSKAPLVKVNCAALPESLIESELFGHEKGAFTGATALKRGRFEMADGGTIFLDEIGELPLDLQAKLLRVLQEDEIERLGGEKTIKVDVRLIAATNRDLEQMMRDGKFREDLFYRLNVFPIHNLPLRERPEDIQPLVEHFVAKFGKQQGKKIERINSSDLKNLKTYPFPGNIRELENLVERSVVLCEGNTLSIKLDRTASTGPVPKKFMTFEEAQRHHIIEALKLTRGRVTGSAGAGKILDMNDRTLVSKMRKLGIEKHEYLTSD